METHDVVETVLADGNRAASLDVERNVWEVLVVGIKLRS